MVSGKMKDNHGVKERNQFFFFLFLNMLNATKGRRQKKTILIEKEIFTITCAYELD